MINLCIPHIMLEPLCPNCPFIIGCNHLKKKENKKLISSRTIQTAELQVEANLGKAEITIEEFLELMQKMLFDWEIHNPLTFT